MNTTIPERDQPPALPRLIFGDRWNYDPAPESADPRIRDQYDLFIDGRSVPPSTGEWFESINPATEKLVSRVPRAGRKDVDGAYAAAEKAFAKTWGKMPPAERGKYIFRISRLIQERAREFAVAESVDSGKPIRETFNFDLAMVAAHFFYYAGWADKIEYAVPGRRAAPLGVAGQVISWSFPLLMLAWKVAPALAAGNCVVLKPAETTSVTALKFAEILRDAELPPGVVNIVTGAGEVGRMIVEHQAAKKIAFTGSTEVGRTIMRATADGGKKLALDLGGKAVNILFADAPIDQAIEGIVNGVFLNQGNLCRAGSRLLVQESIVDDVVERLKRRIPLLRVGDPLDRNTDIGAINSSAQLARIKKVVADGEAEGAHKFQPECALPPRGFFYPPTVFTNVSQSHRIAREEIFGPVLSVLTFRTPEEAILKANNTCYGLSAGVWTDKGALALKMAGALQAGVIWANTFNQFDPVSPFGGQKESGFGREGGAQGILEYIRLEK